ncbi:aminopeptidase N [Penaeus vannamei]|uniref:aminopeptidase N n=1 Tax=Penaeus vannamei TaxID=6689 RepID=UPI00387FA3A3
MNNYNTQAATDVVAMDIHQPDHMVSFGKKKGCYISRSVSLLLAVFFLSGMVATGLLVYYYAPHDVEAKAQQETIRYTQANDNTRNVIPEVTKPPKITTTTTTSTTTTTTTKPMPTTTPTTTTTTMAPKEKVNVRLPRSLKPMRYLVKLQPLINGNFSILGYVEVEMEVLEPTSNITLHIADIITYNDTVKLKGMGNASAPGIKMHEYDNYREFYIAHLDKELQQGEKYVLSMEFLGYLNDQLRGFYRSSYKDEDGKEKMLAVTQFQATSARRAFPCFDEPALKATFEVYLGRQENMSSISNMRIMETMPIEGQEGWLWDHYEESVPMSTYLVAFVVSDFANMNSTVNDHVLFRVWSRQSAIKQAEYSREIGPAILTHFEDYFGEPYPLPKQDMIAIPDFSAGAMENWGLITYRETAMLYDPVVSGPSNKHRVALVVAHELAHQWFGNLVTPTWWTDLWLNEGFASFVQYIGMDYVEPSWKVMEEFVISRLQRVFALDSLESSHEISIPVGHPDEIRQIFDSISYDKGASIIRMMNHFLSENTFRKGVSNYLTAFKYEAAEQDDLWEHLTMAAHEDGTLPQDVTVKKVMDTWTLQMGYPVIKVERSADGMSASVSQNRFLLVAKENSSDDHDYKWWVPLTYTTQSESNFSQTQAMVWMKDSEAQITLSSLPPKDEWVIFNLQETGYYRVNYDDHNWGLLIQQLKDDHEVISTTNRAQIIDDAMDLARAGQLNYEIALGVYAYLGNETEYVPWAAAVNNIGYLEGMFKRKAGYGALKKYILDLVVPLYESVGFTNRHDDPFLEQSKRRTAVSWACMLGHQDCLDNVLSLYRQWMSNPENETLISPNLKSTVYCRAIAEGGEAEWDFAWDQYLKSNVGTEKALLLSAMGCSKEIWILSRYLDMAFTPGSGIRKQDSDRVFASVAYNKVGGPLAWRFLRDQWKRIYDFHGKPKGGLIKSGTSGFNTDLQLKEIELFKQEHEEELGGVSRSVDQVLESTKNSIAWLDRNYETIVQWLDNNGYSTKLQNE